MSQNLKVVAMMERIKELCGVVPKRIHVDNGSKLISKALRNWAYDNQVTLDFSRPGKPTDNPFIESFNGGFRDECFEPQLVPFTRAKLARFPQSTVKLSMKALSVCLPGRLNASWLERGIHNPKTRKFSTLLTKTGCSHSGFIGVF